MLSFLYIFISSDDFGCLIAFVHFTITSLFVRYFIIVFLYHECYVFEKDREREKERDRDRDRVRETESDDLLVHCLSHGFYLSVLPASIKASLGLAVPPRRLQRFPLCFETHPLLHTAFGNSYYLIGSIYVLGTVTDYLINHLSLILNCLY